MTDYFTVQRESLNNPDSSDYYDKYVNDYSDITGFEKGKLFMTEQDAIEYRKMLLIRSCTNYITKSCDSESDFWQLVKTFPCLQRMDWDDVHQWTWEEIYEDGVLEDEYRFLDIPDRMEAVLRQHWQDDCEAFVDYFLNDLPAPIVTKIALMKE